MAKNLRSKISSGDTLIVFDVNNTATEQFLADVGADSHTAVAKDVKEVAEKSVCLISLAIFALFNSNDELFFPKKMYDLSWGCAFCAVLHLILTTHQSQSSDYYQPSPCYEIYKLHCRAKPD